MQKLIGRSPEIEILKDALNSPKAELIAVYGRRRVGKTYLIHTVYEKNMVFEMTGLKDANLSEQLENFSETLEGFMKTNIPVARPQTWMKAFRMLLNFLSSQKIEGKKVVFLDEFPWLDTPKSGFLTAFDHFWNTWASRQSDLVVVICGSAASWMIQNIVRNKGGLHNRITQRMRLLPFNLNETELFLKDLYVNLDQYQILQLYMVTGGIPHYLNFVKPGESTIQIIDRLCFTNEGGLRDEFKNLYIALFENAEKHINVVRKLANKPSGLTRKEISLACEISSGGTLTKILEELEESGFIFEYIPFGKTANEAIFKLGDEYSLFYLKFIENSKALGKGTWIAKANSASWISWSGLAFENICLKHIPQIKRKLGIEGIYTEPSIWRYLAKDGEVGVQIDLVLDRKDNSINLLEIKYNSKEFVIESKYAAELRNKINVFATQTGTRKSLFLTMLTTNGVKMNEHYLGLVQNQIIAASLFENVV
jgi:uncharacterized protein